MLATLAGCGSQASGSITGSLHILEGGTAYHTVAGSGKLVIREGNRLVATKQVSSGHSFDISLPIGTYKVSATAPDARYQSGTDPATLQQQGPATVTVTVTANKTSTVGWSCPIQSAIG
jgi:hypothetical protein